MSRYHFNHHPSAWLLAGAACILAGCATQDLQRVNQDLAKLNRALAVGGAVPVGNAGGIATHPPQDNGKSVELIVPNDKTTEAAMEAALPVIKKVLSIHQCVTHVDGMRQLNFHSVPGADFTQVAWYKYPMGGMRYHDKSRCLSVRTLDSWVMPALNALVFRAVYFAEDSGETAVHALRFMRGPDGTWRLAAISHINTNEL